MTVDMSKYEELLRQFGGISDNYIRGEVLENVKEKYRDEIHSKRVLESIVNISSLLQVLKKRQVLQYNDITALIDINNEYVRDESIKQQLEDLIRKYNKWLERNSGSIKFLYNSAVPGYTSTQGASEQLHLNMPFYITSTTASYSTQSTFSANHTQIYSTSAVPPVNVEHELRQIVVRDLSKRIGAFWNRVCRNLDISENIIDEITIKYSQEPEGQKYMKMFEKGMKIYFSEPRPRWKDELLNALKAAERIDLQNGAQEIILNHSNL